MPKPDLSRLDSLPSDGSGFDAENFDSDELIDPVADELENTVLRLSDYLAAIELVVKETFQHSVWVKAEIRNLSSKNGHYYFELAEKDDDGKVIASCRGNLWRFKAARVLGKFERVTGMQLERDVTVLLNVTATFHPLYGFSLAINDIDPSYTLGDLARQYAAMLERLSAEGLLNLNKQVPDPFDIEHVLVIAPEKAAGLGDFRADADRLQHTGACHFHYHYATFQGNHAPKEIRHAITKGILTFKKEYDRLPDVMVIIRGGGAVGDLAYLNDYELAALVAEQPIPVWVGIGHERDNVILDEVAHTSFDTPSKVIAGITNHLASLMQRTQDFADTIWHASQQQVTQAAMATERQFTAIQNTSSYNLQRWQHLSDSHFNTIKQHAKFELRQASMTSNTNMKQIQQLSYNHLSRASSAIDTRYQTIKESSYQRLSDAAKQVRYYQQVVLIQNPARLLDQGYAFVQNSEDKYLNSVSSIEKGDFVKVSMSDGEVKAVVYDVNKHSTADTDSIEADQS
ncbi:exodeoxyribonuclease VII large subunit [Psychrobacter sp. FDAARGOS_221]|uniref:exodeoxyribonuclease VII large subunit n=1 Tax=Psychrobacter sp. FDAARGOS_221 TaxID=1975705 RepID=UPI000BB52C2F|nr:exodeoxyribonuclease VII large subunit [Psychrobacter sp. FDAARGOS_221]PNK59538.1 exodeoxyribonuclease VII large subunit [Psychrobacter sp. FDAARGOS_221]